LLERRQKEESQNGLDAILDSLPPDPNGITMYDESINYKELAQWYKVSEIPLNKS